MASDSAYIEKPVTANETLVGPSEITDIVVDFSRSKSDVAILANDAKYPYPSGDPVNEANGKVIKFIIIPDHDQQLHTSRLPKRFLEYPLLDLSSVTHTRYVAMYEYASDIDEPTHLYLNAKPYEAPATENPKVGSTELLKPHDEFTECMTKINDAVKCHVDKYARGKKIEVPAHEKGWKNVFKMMPGHVTKVAVRFSYIHTNASYAFDATTEPGYVYHCHVSILTLSCLGHRNVSSSFFKSYFSFILAHAWCRSLH